MKIIVNILLFSFLYLSLSIPFGYVIAIGFLTWAIILPIVYYFLSKKKKLPNLVKLTLKEFIAVFLISIVGSILLYKHSYEEVSGIFRWFYGSFY